MLVFGQQSNYGKRHTKKAIQFQGGCIKETPLNFSFILRHSIMLVIVILKRPFAQLQCYNGPNLKNMPKGTLEASPLLTLMMSLIFMVIRVLLDLVTTTLEQKKLIKLLRES